MDLSLALRSPAWRLIRALGFWAIGLMNSVFRAPGAEPDWRLAVGVVILIIAAADTAFALHGLMKRRAS